jgi:hypothetical protein
VANGRVLKRHTIPWTWRLRRALWNAFFIFKYHESKPDVIGAPQSGRPIVAVPLDTKYAGIEIRKILVADHVPRDESYLIKRIFGRFQALLYGIFGPMQQGLAPIAGDPDAILADAYSPAHRRCFPAPTRPRAFEDGTDLAALAVASPYACYLHADGSGGFRWDLSALDGFERHGGLRSPAAVVEFRIDEAGRLQASRIDSEIGSLRAGEAGWELAMKLALCGATTHLSLVRHFNGVHLACGAQMAIATRNELPTDHPLSRLMWPHVFGTQYSNEIITIDQMVRGGDFESVFSFTHGGTCRLIESTFAEFDLAAINPRLDAAQRGIAQTDFATPAMDNRVVIYDAIEMHCRRYLDLYYKSDDVLDSDRFFVAWLNALERGVPKGVRHVAGTDVTIDGTARLVATLIYLATVEHEIVGSGLWDYQLWTDVQPVRVANDGSREPLDVYQRLVNANFNLNIHRTPLLTDFTSLALDARGAGAFDQFRADLIALQAAIDGEPPASWRMAPNRLKANINA